MDEYTLAYFKPNSNLINKLFFLMSEEQSHGRLVGKHWTEEQSREGNCVQIGANILQGLQLQRGLFF